MRWKAFFGGLAVVPKVLCLNAHPPQTGGVEVDGEMKEAFVDLSYDVEKIPSLENELSSLFDKSSIDQLPLVVGKTNSEQRIWDFDAEAYLPLGEQNIKGGIGLEDDGFEDPGGWVTKFSDQLESVASSRLLFIILLVGGLAGAVLGERSSRISTKRSRQTSTSTRHGALV
mmetsp:Transcript_635/g.903  ORF Transcript_635/g.903 Transcript_635/m.903 type:complete len:171 (+) Transcript_635:77-589(+)